jgi:hypothetical protein
MFDNLGDPLGPPNADALDAVLTRAQHKRHMRIRAIAAAAAFAVVIIVAASVAFAAGSGGPSRRVVVEQQPTSTTGAPEETTTIPESTTTGEPATSTTTAPNAGVVPPPTVPDTTTTTVPHSPNDTSHIIAFFDPPALTIRSGDSATIHVKYVNDGPWDVGWSHGDLGCPYNVDGGPKGEQQLLLPTPLWPVSTANAAPCPADAVLVHLAPGESTTETVKILAGTEDIDGNIVPGVPGADCFIPSYAPLGDTKNCTGNVLPITITPPANAPFTVNRPTTVTVATNHEVRVPFTLTNNLGFAVSFDFVGPQTYGTGQGACVRSTNTRYFWSCTINIGAHQTLSMDADISATSNLDGPYLGNTPLKPGVYNIPWNEITLKLTVTP